MKWFWVIVLVLVVATGVLLMARGRGTSPGGVQVTRATESAPVGRTREVGNGDSRSAERVNDEGKTPDGQVLADVARPVRAPVLVVEGPAKAEASAAASKPRDEAGVAGTSEEGSGEAARLAAEQSDEALKESEGRGASGEPSRRATTEQQAAEAAKARAIADALDAALRGEDPFSHSGTGADAVNVKEPGRPAGQTGTAATEAASKSNAEVSPSTASKEPRLELQADGTTLVDGKYVIAGSGTHEQPYRVPWEMLASAERTYQPRLGRKEIPAYLTMLNDKWVTIGGYIAFPIMAQTQDEMLMMLNQWDGCCIGVPPTPYDAIEVKLKAAAKGDDRLKLTGSITGKFKVDPFLVKDWLVSLYLMDDAELAATGAAQAAPGQHQGK